MSLNILHFHELCLTAIHWNLVRKMPREPGYHLAPPLGVVVGGIKKKKKKKKSQARLLICSTPRCQQDGTLFLPPNLWWRAEWISGQPVSCKSLQGLATQLLALLLLKARLQNWEKNSWSYQTAGGGAVAGLTAQNAEILRPFLWRQQQSRNIAQGAF